MTIIGVGELFNIGGGGQSQRDQTQYLGGGVYCKMNIHACMHIHTYAHMHMHVSKYSYTHACTHTHTYACMHMRMHAYIYISTS